MTGVPGIGWQVEHGTPPERSGEGSTCAAWAPPSASVGKKQGSRGGYALAPEPWHVEHASTPPVCPWQLVQDGAPGAASVTPAGRAGVPSWQRPHAFGSFPSSICDQCDARKSAP